MMGDTSKLIRKISRSPAVRKLTPYPLQRLLWERVLRGRGRALSAAVAAYVNRHPGLAEGRRKAAVDFLAAHPDGFFDDRFYELFKAGDGGKTWFDFGGLLPDISGSREKMHSLYQIFQDVFLFPCLLNDDYAKDTVQFFDQCMMEGPYGYTDGAFDVTVKENDVVIDAGAWIGDFSAYAAWKGAAAYAFEPLETNYRVLLETQALNGGGSIIPVKMGLGERSSSMDITINDKDSSGSSMYYTRSGKTERITITALDEYAAENRLERISFIKSDIEGAERDLLRGARQTLRTFAPKLAICTYHAPEDPQLLESIIREANPKYTVVHTRQKLFAMVLR